MKDDNLCAITQQPCSMPDGCFEAGADGCEIRRYKNSNRNYLPGESKSGARGVIDGTCRYFNSRRVYALRNHQFMEGE